MSFATTTDGQANRNTRAFPGTRSTARLPEWVAVGGILALALAVRVWFGPHLRDDAYITFRYALRLAGGHGFTFNDGERVLGTTTPLYTVILAGLARFGQDPGASALIIGYCAVMS